MSQNYEQEVNIVLKATDAASSVFKTAGDNVKREMSAMSDAQKANSARVNSSWDQAAFAKFRQEEQEAAKIAHEARQGFLEKLNESVGRKSELGHGLHALEGGGAVLGLGLATHLLGELSNKVVEFDKELREGKKGGDEIADSLARSLPILGGIYTAGRNIHEIFSAEAAEVEQINRVSEIRTKGIEVQREALQKMKETYKELANTARDFAIARAQVGLSGAAKESQAIGAEMGKAEADKAEEVKKLIEAMRKPQEEKIKELEKEANAATTHGLRTRFMEAFGQDPTGVDREKDEKEADERRHAAQKALEGIYKEQGENEKKIREQYEKTHAEGTALSNDKLNEIQIEFDRKEQEAAQAHGEEMGKIAADGRVTALRASRQDREADLAELESRLEMQKAASQKALDEGMLRALQSAPDGMAAMEEMDRLQREAAEKRAALDAKHEQDKAAINSTRDEQDIERREAFEHRLAQIRIDALKAAGATDPAAAADAKRLEINERYKRVLGEIQKTLRENKELTASDRERAQGQMDSLGLARIQELARVGLPNIGAYRSPEAVRGQGDTGAGRFAAETMQQVASSAAQDQLRAALEIQKSLADVPKLIDAALGFFDGTAGLQLESLFTGMLQ